MTIDANNIKQIRKELENLLTAYGEAVNIKFDLGNLLYDSNSIKFSLQGRVKGSMIPGTSGLFVGQEGTHKNIGTCKVIGFNSRTRKPPLIVETPTGVQYRIPENSFIPTTSI